MEQIGENAIFMHFHVIVPDIPLLCHSPGKIPLGGYFETLWPKK